VLQTRDGGRSWHHVYCFEKTFLCSVAALDRRHVWVVGNNYRLLRSSGWNDWNGWAVAPAPTQAPVAASGDGRANTRAPSSLSIW
jgi:photosystem II stability/assembly factor-like uncharacterized protein